MPHRVSYLCSSTFTDFSICLKLDITSGKTWRKSYDGERRLHSALANTEFPHLLQGSDLTVGNRLAELMEFFCLCLKVAFGRFY